MKTLFIITSITTILFSTGCNVQPSFKVEGKVSDAVGKTLYLEIRDIHENMIIDSCKLGESGDFSFIQPRPEYPQFYALKLENEHIFFSIDSTETLQINTQAKAFATQYDVNGSENAQKIKELGQLQYAAQQKVNELLKSNLPGDSLSSKIKTILDTYKEQAISYILTGKHTSIQSPVAYFAIFQRINDYLIFDMYDEKDNKVFATVATGFDLAYPDSPRSKHLKMLTLQARSVIQKAKTTEFEANYSNNIEIELPNIKGDIIKLSSTAGKVVILDFTLYQSEFSPDRNMNLRKLHEKYQTKGLEIYQIAFDANVHFWKISASNLPWVCVRDAAGTYSQVALSYNISELPTYYLLNREGELRKKGTLIDQSFENEILKLL